MLTHTCSHRIQYTHIFLNIVHTSLSKANPHLLTNFQWHADSQSYAHNHFLLKIPGHTHSHTHTHTLTRTNTLARTCSLWHTHSKVNVPYRHRLSIINKSFRVAIRFSVGSKTWELIFSLHLSRLTERKLSSLFTLPLSLSFCVSVSSFFYSCFCISLCVS